MMTLVASAMALLATMPGEAVTIDASFREAARRPTALFVSFTNGGPQEVSLTGLAGVVLKGAGGEFRGPFDLERLGPIGANARTTLVLPARATRRVIHRAGRTALGQENFFLLAVHAILRGDPGGNLHGDGRGGGRERAPDRVRASRGRLHRGDGSRA